jgi:hypothetical protein
MKSNLELRQMFKVVSLNDRPQPPLFLRRKEADTGIIFSPAAHEPGRIALRLPIFDS